MTILVEDINDNDPLFAISHHLMLPNSNKHSMLSGNDEDNFTLMATVNENEMGPLFFHDAPDRSSQARLVLSRREEQSRHFIVYDPDLGANSRFEIVVAPSFDQPGSDALANRHFKFGHDSLIDVGSGSSLGKQKNTISSPSLYAFSSSSLLAFNHEPFDFDTLNLEPSIDSETGVASKTLKFNVMRARFLAKTHTSEIIFQSGFILKVARSRNVYDEKK